jgi:hypothetical protein
MVMNTDRPSDALRSTHEGCSSQVLVYLAVDYRLPAYTRSRPHKDTAYTWDETYTFPENLFLAATLDDCCAAKEEIKNSWSIVVRIADQYCSEFCLSNS